MARVVADQKRSYGTAPRRVPRNSVNAGRRHEVTSGWNDDRSAKVVVMVNTRAPAASRSAASDRAGRSVFA